MSTYKTYDSSNMLMASNRQYHNSEKEVIRYEGLNQLGNIEIEITSEFVNGKLAEQRELDHINGAGSRTVHAYDAHGNPISEHVYHRAGRLMEWKENTYDAHNRLSSEKGFSNFAINSRYIDYYHDKEFHFRHEYEH